MDLLLTVRLDEGKDYLKEWINNNEDRRLYLGGVGCLWDEGAGRRLIHESANTLDGFNWPAAQVVASILREHYKSCHQIGLLPTAALHVAKRRKLSVYVRRFILLTSAIATSLTNNEPQGVCFAPS
ncbi:hypothetical protein Ddc_22357 [Ditylenchus destructor]|nr:hypothetical protein Ddc_22357 [Ditylenchus destructor]